MVDVEVVVIKGERVWRFAFSAAGPKAERAGRAEEKKRGKELKSEKEGRNTTQPLAKQSNYVLILYTSKTKDK